MKIHSETRTKMSQRIIHSTFHIVPIDTENIVSLVYIFFRLLSFAFSSSFSFSIVLCKSFRVVANRWHWSMMKFVYSSYLIDLKSALNEEPLKVCFANNIDIDEFLLLCYTLLPPRSIPPMINTDCNCWTFAAKFTFGLFPVY